MEEIFRTKPQTVNKFFYTGIGSRMVPLNSKYSKLIIGIRKALSGEYVLRSGGADGCDSLFEYGAGNLKEIYLPWKGFNRHTSPLYNVTEERKYIASQVHPKWKQLKEPVKLLHARNVYQVLGSELNSPSDFLICWTPDSASCYEDVTIMTGGTGTRIKLASLMDITIINLFKFG